MVVGKHLIDTKIVNEIRENLNELKKNIRKIEAERDLELSFEEKFVKKSELMYLLNEKFENFLNGGLLEKDVDEIMKLEILLNHLASELPVESRVNKIKKIINNYNLPYLEIKLLDIKGKKFLIAEVDEEKIDENPLENKFYEELNKNKVFEREDGFYYVTKGLYIHENENGSAIIDLINERCYVAKNITNLQYNNILILEQQNKQELYLIDKKRKLRGNSRWLNEKVIELEKSEGEKEIFLLHESKYFKIEFIKKQGKYYEYKVKGNKKIEQENLINEVELNEKNGETNKKIEGKLAKKVLLSENYNLINIGSYENLKVKEFKDGIEVLEFRNNNKRAKSIDTTKIKDLIKYSEREVKNEKNKKLIILKNGEEVKKIAFYEHLYEEGVKLELTSINTSYSRMCLNIEVIYKTKENSLKIYYNIFPWMLDLDFDLDVDPIIIKE